jgi:glycosyltransferase involved in cell wall biosynthesis
MNDPLKVTVITIVRNGAIQIQNTINSVQSQNYESFEHIIIDGLSEDKTTDFLKSSTGLIWYSEADDGIYDAMNKGIKRSSGVYILFMNCGDVFYDSKSLQNLVAGITKNNSAIAFGGWARRDPSGTRFIKPDLQGRRLNHQAILYRKDLHVKFGPYINRSKFLVADYEFFTRLMADSSISFAIINEPVAIIDTCGASANENNFTQKTFIDFIDGRLNKVQLLLYLAFHPLYILIKKLLRIL